MNRFNITRDVNLLQLDILSMSFPILYTRILLTPSTLRLNLIFGNQYLTSEFPLGKGFTSEGLPREIEDLVLQPIYSAK